MGGGRQRDPEPREMGWQEVEEAARLAFSIWDPKVELNWAERAWEMLVRAGLARHADGFQRHRVWFDFLALAGIYNNFIEAAWEEWSDLEYGDWAEPFDLDPFLVGQLYARSPDWKENPRLELEDGLRSLVEARRDGVARILLERFGGPQALYESLWIVARDARAAEFGEEPEPENRDPWKPRTEFKARAFAWVKDACPRFR